MAELGNIDFRDVNAGTRTVDRSGEVRAAAQIASVGKTALEEGIKAKVTGDMLEAIHDSDQVEELSQGDQPLMRYEDGTREAYLANQIASLRSKVAQGNSHQRKIAEMRIKAIMNEAQSRYPWMYEDLQRRAGQVIAGNAELERLGMEDASMQEGADLAQRQLQEMYDKGIADIEDGGYGIDPAIPIGSPQWLAEYAEGSKLYKTLHEDKAHTLYRVAMANSDLANGGAEIIRQDIRGRYSLTRASVMQAYHSSGFLDVLQEFRKGDKANLGFVNAWMTGGARTTLQLDLRAIADDLRASKDLVFQDPYALRTEEGKQLSNEFDAMVTRIDNLVEALDNAVNDPDTVQFHANVLDAAHMQAYGRLEGQDKAYATMMLSPMFSKALQAGQLGMFPQGMDLFNRMNQSVPTIFEKMYPAEVGRGVSPEGAARHLTGTGAESVPVDAQRPEDINSAIDAKLKNGETMWPVPTSTGRQRVEAAVTNAAVAEQYFKTQMDTLDDPNVGPTVATDTLARLNHSFRELKDEAQYAQLNDTLTSFLGSEELTNGIKAADRTHSNAFALSATEWFNKTNPQGRREAMYEEYRSTPTDVSVQLSEAISLNVDALLEGEIVWDYNEGAIEMTAQSIAASRGGSNRVSQADRDTARYRLGQYAKRWTDEMKRQIGVYRNLNLARAEDPKNPPVRDEFIQYYFENFKDIFTPVEG